MKRSAIVSLIVLFIMAINTTVSYANSNEIIEPGKILIVEQIESPNEVGYWCDVIGNGVRLRSTPYINNSNILRTLYYGDRLWVYQSGINVAYHDGYWWSYVEHVSSGTWRYVASKYFATNSGYGFDNPMLME